MKIMKMNIMKALLLTNNSILFIIYKLKLYIFLIIFIVLTVNLKAENTDQNNQNSKEKYYIRTGAGLAYAEEALLIIIRSQFSPFLYFDYEQVFRVKRTAIVQNWHYSLTLWPWFFKYTKPYITDKTLALDMPLEYSLIFKIPYDYFIYFSGGFGSALYLRWDRYSLGHRYWYSLLKFSPYPFLSLGFGFNILNRVSIDLSERIGASSCVNLTYIKQDYYSYAFLLFFHNHLQISGIIRITDKYYATLGWKNKINLYVNMENYFLSFIYFHNYFYTGIRIAIY